MAKGKTYPILLQLKKEYSIASTNKEFDNIVSLHARKTLSPRKIYFLYCQYGKLKSLPKLIHPPSGRTGNNDSKASEKLSEGATKTQK